MIEPLNLDEPPDALPKRLVADLDAALDRGLTGLWSSHSPVGPGPDAFELATAIERAGGALRGPPVVTLCPYLVEGLDAADTVGRFTEVSELHEEACRPLGPGTADLQARLGSYSPPRRRDRDPAGGIARRRADAGFFLTSKLSAAARCPAGERHRGRGQGRGGRGQVVLERLQPVQTTATMVASWSPRARTRPATPAPGASPPTRSVRIRFRLRDPRLDLRSCQLELPTGHHLLLRRADPVRQHAAQPGLRCPPLAPRVPEQVRHSQLPDWDPRPQRRRSVDARRQRPRQRQLGDRSRHDR